MVKVTCLRCGKECYPTGNGRGRTKYCIECKVELYNERIATWKREKRQLSKLGKIP